MCSSGIIHILVEDANKQEKVYQSWDNGNLFGLKDVINSLRYFI